MKTKVARELLLLLIVFGFAAGKPQIISGQINSEDKPEFKQIFDEYEVNGTFVLFDLKRNHFIRYNTARARQRFLPLSTFKIPNSLIALETGIVKDENTILKWSGEKYDIAGWNQDLTFKEALSASCVPCYQQIASKVGDLRMKKFLKTFKYGNQNNSGGIDRFWLDGGLRISADEEVEFLRRFFTGKLPVSKRSTEILKQMLILERQPNYILSGKTGLQLGLSSTGIPKLSIPVSPKLGWFVGYLEQDGEVYFFATNIESANPRDNFLAARIEITRKILQRIGLL